MGGSVFRRNIRLFARKFNRRLFPLRFGRKQNALPKNLAEILIGSGRFSDTGNEADAAERKREAAFVAVDMRGGGLMSHALEGPAPGHFGPGNSGGILLHESKTAGKSTKIFYLVD